MGCANAGLRSRGELDNELMIFALACWTGLGWRLVLFLDTAMVMAGLLGDQTGIHELLLYCKVSLYFTSVIYELANQ